MKSKPAWCPGQARPAAGDVFVLYKWLPLNEQELHPDGSSTLQTGRSATQIVPPPQHASQRALARAADSGPDALCRGTDAREPRRRRRSGQPSTPVTMLEEDVALGRPKLLLNKTKNKTSRCVTLGDRDQLRFSACFVDGRTHRLFFCHDKGSSSCFVGCFSPSRDIYIRTLGRTR